MVIALRQYFSVPPALPLTSPFFFSYHFILQPTFLSHLPGFIASPMLTVICTWLFPSTIPFRVHLVPSTLTAKCTSLFHQQSLLWQSSCPLQGSPGDPPEACPILPLCPVGVKHCSSSECVCMLCITSNTGVCVTEGDCNLGWILTESPPLVFSEMFGISQRARAEPQGVEDFDPAVSFTQGFASSETSCPR